MTTVKTWAYPSGNDLVLNLKRRDREAADRSIDVGEEIDPATGLAATDL